MLKDLSARLPDEWKQGLLGTVVGVAVGAMTALLATSLSAPLLALFFLGILVFLPTFLLKDFSLYWLWGYLFFLPFEAGKRVTNLSIDPEEMLNSIGLPPSTYLGIKIFPTDFVLVPLLVLWLFQLRRGRVKLLVPGYTYLLVGYLAWVTISSLVKAQYLSLSVAQLFQEYKYLIVFLFFTSLAGSRAFLKFLVGTLIATLSLQILVALPLLAAGYTRDSLAERLNLGVEHEYDFLREEEKDLRVGEAVQDLRASGTFGAASHLAMYLQLLFPLPLCLAMAVARGWRRVLLFLLFFLSAITLYLTLSRAGLLGLMMGTGLSVILLRWRGYLSNKFFAWLLYAGVLVLALQIVPMYEHVASRPYTFWHRFTLAKEGMQVVARNPVMGVGANHSTLARLETAAIQPYVSLSTENIVPFDNLYPIHNQYIVVAAESGLVGFSLGVMFFLVLCAKAYRLSSSAEPLVGVAGIWVLSGFVALGCQLLGDHFVGNAQHTMLFLNAALVAGLSRQSKQGLPSDRGRLDGPSGL